MLTLAIIPLCCGVRRGRVVPVITHSALELVNTTHIERWVTVAEVTLQVLTLSSDFSVHLFTAVILPVK